MIKDILIGSDPEFFIFKEDIPESSIGLIKGTKRRPEEVAPGYGILKDNVLIEGNIPPAESKEEFVSNIKQLKTFMSELIGPHSLVCADSAKFTDQQLNNFEARQFGCAPYFNAWTLNTNSPKNLANLNWRVAGFHIHLGYTYDGSISSDYMAMYITRAFDYFVVYPSRQIFDDPIRAKYYGDFGNFRIKPYGVECRSLGGYFCNDEYLDWVYEQSMKAIEFCNNPENIEKLEKVQSPEIDTEKNYEILNIKLEEQVYGNIANNQPGILAPKKTV
ncbi:MAG: hypothetical protein ACOC3V_00410 [bacterium]